MIKKIYEDWNNYKTVVPGKNKENIKKFRSLIETVLIPALSEINIDVDINSAETLNNGVVVYEAMCQGTLMSIELQSNNIEKLDNEQLFAVLYTTSNSTDVGSIDLNDKESIKQYFLDALEELDIDPFEKDKEEAKKEEFLKKTFGVSGDKGNIIQEPEKVEPDVVDSEDKVPEEIVSGLDTFKDAYVKAVVKIREVNKINSVLKVVLSKKNTPNMTILEAVYISRNRCLVVSDEFGLDQVTSFDGLGKYIADLSDKEYVVDFIYVYSEDGKKLFEIEVKEE